MIITIQGSSYSHEANAIAQEIAVYLRKLGLEVTSSFIYSDPAHEIIINALRNEGFTIRVEVK